jgi:hypothetical protein
MQSVLRDLLSLAAFAWPGAFEFHPCCCVCHPSVPSSGDAGMGKAQPSLQELSLMMREALGPVARGLSFYISPTQFCPTSFLVLVYLAPHPLCDCLRIKPLTLKYQVGLERAKRLKPGRVLETSSPTWQLCNLVLNLAQSGTS